MIDLETKAARKKRIIALLDAAFDPGELSVTDESHLHEGHPGAASGGGHYQIHIVSSAFEGQSRIQRHRAVYQALKDMLEGEIHALGIDAKTPDEERGRPE